MLSHWATLSQAAPPNYTHRVGSGDTWCLMRVATLKQFCQICLDGERKKYNNSIKNIENYVSAAMDWELNKSDGWKLIAIAPNCKRIGRWILKGRNFSWNDMDMVVRRTSEERKYTITNSDPENLHKDQLYWGQNKEDIGN